MFKHYILCGAFLAVAVPAFASTTVFYSGDFDPSNENANGLANETNTTVAGTPGAATYEAFLVPAGGWTVNGLFTNDLMDFFVTDAYWEIRSGLSEGNAGTLLFSGTDNNATQTVTGRSGFGFTEYTVEVDGLNIFLPQGEYWLAVVPENPPVSGTAFNSNTFGLNAIGTGDTNNQFFNSAFFSANFTNGNNEGVFADFSAGVIASTTPEPGSVGMVLGGIAMLWVGLLRRRA